VLENPSPRLRYVVGTDAKAGLLLRKLLPWSLFERLIMRNTGLDK